MNTNRILLSSLLLTLFLVGACTEAPDETSAVGKPEAVAWADFRSNFIEEYIGANPVFAVDIGRHEFDGLLPDHSSAGQATDLQQLHDWMHQLESFDAASLNDVEKFEREYLKAELEEQLFWLEDVAVYNRNPVIWGYSAFPSVYLTRDYAPLEQRLDAFNTYLENLPGYLDDMRATIDGPIPRTWLATAKGMYGGLDQFFGSDVSAIFASVADPARQQRLADALASAREALQQTVTWLDTAEVNEDFALGAERYRKMLWVTERVDTPIAELKAIGEADMERNLAAMREACDAFAPGLSLVDCAAKAKLDKPAEGPVDGAKRQLHALKQFVVEHDIVSIPADDPVTVDAAPPYNASNLAYIEIPGVYEKALTSVYYIAPPNPEWSTEQQQQYLPGENDLLFISVHEVWPGHFLNFLHAKQSDSILGRMFVGYAFAEGWAHYTEELMYDAGYGENDPQMHIGQLTNALLRNARFLSSIGLHTEGMTVEASEQMFIEKGLQDKGNAMQQAYRGTTDPGYLNYTLGKLMIMKLRDDWSATRGGRDAWKAFHDEFLSYGGPPIPMVRKAMLPNDDGKLFALPVE